MCTAKLIGLEPCVVSDYRNAYGQNIHIRPRDSSVPRAPKILGTAPRTPLRNSAIVLRAKVNFTGRFTKLFKRSTGARKNGRRDLGSLFRSFGNSVPRQLSGRICPGGGRDRAPPPPSVYGEIFVGKTAGPVGRWRTRFCRRRRQPAPANVPLESRPRARIFPSGLISQRKGHVKSRVTRVFLDFSSFPPLRARPKNVSGDAAVIRRPVPFSRPVCGIQRQGHRYKSTVNRLESSEKNAEGREKKKNQTSDVADVRTRCAPEVRFTGFSSYYSTDVIISSVRKSSSIFHRGEKNVTGCRNARRINFQRTQTMYTNAKTAAKIISTNE